MSPLLGHLSRPLRFSGGRFEFRRNSRTLGYPYFPSRLPRRMYFTTVRILSQPYARQWYPARAEEMSHLFARRAVIDRLGLRRGARQVVPISELVFRALTQNRSSLEDRTTTHRCHRASGRRQVLTLLGNLACNLRHLDIHDSKIGSLQALLPHLPPLIERPANSA
jgi:hypothetical protein